MNLQLPPADTDTKKKTHPPEYYEHKGYEDCFDLDFDINDAESIGGVIAKIQKKSSYHRDGEHLKQEKRLSDAIHVLQANKKKIELIKDRTKGDNKKDGGKKQKGDETNPTAQGNGDWKAVVSLGCDGDEISKFGLVDEKPPAYFEMNEKQLQKLSVRFFFCVSIFFFFGCIGCICCICCFDRCKDLHNVGTLSHFQKYHKTRCQFWRPKNDKIEECPPLTENDNGGVLDKERKKNRKRKSRKNKRKQSAPAKSKVKAVCIDSGYASDDLDLLEGLGDIGSTIPIGTCTSIASFIPPSDGASIAGGIPSSDGGSIAGGIPSSDGNSNVGGGKSNGSGGKSNEKLDCNATDDGSKSVNLLTLIDLQWEIAAQIATVYSRCGDIQKMIGDRNYQACMIEISEKLDELKRFHPFDHAQVMQQPRIQAFYVAYKSKHIVNTWWAFKTGDVVTSGAALNGSIPSGGVLNSGIPSGTGLNADIPSADGLISGIPSGDALIANIPSADGLNADIPSGTGLNSGIPSADGLNADIPSGTGLISGIPNAQGLNAGIPSDAALNTSHLDSIIAPENATGCNENGNLFEMSEEEMPNLSHLFQWTGGNDDN